MEAIDESGLVLAGIPILRVDGLIVLLFYLSCGPVFDTPTQGHIRNDTAGIHDPSGVEQSTFSLRIRSSSSGAL